MIIHNWRDVLRSAWSVRLMAVAGILTGIEAALPLLDGYVDVPRRTFAAVTFAVVCGAFIARFFAQKGLSK
jgi:hypothetical protein